MGREPQSTSHQKWNLTRTVHRQRLYRRDYSIAEVWTGAPEEPEGASSSPGRKGEAVPELELGGGVVLWWGRTCSQNREKYPTLSLPRSLSCWCLIVYRLRLGGVSLSGTSVRSILPNSSWFWHHIVHQSLWRAGSLGPHVHLPVWVVLSRKSLGAKNFWPTKYIQICKGQKFIYFYNVFPFLWYQDTGC